MQQLEEALHGRLDLHLHRSCLDLRQPLQGNVLLHGEGGGDVPGGGLLRESSPHLCTSRQHVQVKTFICPSNQFYPSCYLLLSILL